jgi:hypothetical protein
MTFWKYTGIRILSPLLVLLAFSTPLESQHIRGIVIDDDTGAPIEAVSVMLIGSSGNLERSGLSDVQGAFHLFAPRTGRYLVRLDRIGYKATTSSEIDLLPPDTVAVELRMSIAVVILAPLTITSSRAPLVMDTRLASWGYYDRRAQYSTMGSGQTHFLGLEDIRRRNPMRVSDVFRDLAGTRVAVMGGTDVQVRRADGCRFTFFLDGAELRMSSDDSVDDFLMASHLSAVEVYVRPPFPAEYFPNAFGPKACGSVVLWSGFVQEAGGKD